MNVADAQREVRTAVLGGYVGFPLTQLGLRLIGRRGASSRGNPQGPGMQVAFGVLGRVLVAREAAAEEDGPRPGSA
jgi:hypothetical protein